LQLAKIRFVGSIHELLDVRRHLVAVREQQVPARHQLLDRIAKGDALQLQLGNVFLDLHVGGAPFLRPGFLERKVEKVRSIRQSFLSFRVRRLVVVKIVAQNGAANGLQFSRYCNDSDGIS
jgi:hypothetical protein